MTTGQIGRTAPWAKALGAVLLVLLATLLVSYGIGNYRETSRKDAAFEATREDAKRFADAVTTQDDKRPVDRQDIERALATARGTGLLFGLESADRSTRVSIQFSRMYQRSLAIFGPAEAMADRCFTIVFRVSNQGRQAQITPHGSEEACTEVARQNQ